MNLVLIAISPVLILAFYIYLRDKYEREPIGQLLLALAGGCIITLPVSFVESWLSGPLLTLDGYASVAWNAFAVAAFTEEMFKFLALMIFFWNNRNFNEKFDGIVYASFISLGFAGVENVLYVAEGGVGVGMVRAITAVPAHALFGILMGYHVGLARFYPGERSLRLLLALVLPILLHGIYDFLLMSGRSCLLLVFIPYIVFLWIFGFRRMRQLSDRSIFRLISGNRFKGSPGI
jgi:RsiW-degrading membrane proteinase PrsW (M82 family)